MVKNPDLGFGMNMPDHVSESFETISQLLGLKMLKFFAADSGSGPGSFLTLDPGMENFGSGILFKHHVSEHWSNVFYTELLRL